MWLADSVRENRKSAPAKVFIKMVYLQKVGVWVYVYGCEIPIIGNFKLRRKCSKEKSEGHCKLVFFLGRKKTNRRCCLLKCDVAQQSVLWRCSSLGERQGQHAYPGDNGASWCSARRQGRAAQAALAGCSAGFTLSLASAGRNAWLSCLLNLIVMLLLSFHYDVSCLEDVILCCVAASLWRTDVRKK